MSTGFVLCSPYATEPQSPVSSAESQVSKSVWQTSYCFYHAMLASEADSSIKESTSKKCEQGNSI